MNNFFENPPLSFYFISFITSCVVTAIIGYNIFGDYGILMGTLVGMLIWIFVLILLNE